MKTYGAIRSTGSYVPKREVTNAELRARFGETVDKMAAVSGIWTRFYARDDEATSDLAAEAAKVALARAAVDAKDVDLVVVGTDSPDFITPSTSVITAHKLGASRAGTFDVGCACASFPTALATCSGLMAENPDLENVLVVGAYLMHRLADPADPMIFFYGDGAGAALLQRSREPGVMRAAFRADGGYARRWGIFGGGTRDPDGPRRVRMIERYPPEVNEDGWPELVRRVARSCEVELEAIDRLFFTQVRKETIERVMQRLALPLERAPMIMHKWGYTGSACIPMALDDANVKPGELAVLVGSGVGFNQAAVAVRFTDSFVSRGATSKASDPGTSANSA